MVYRIRLVALAVVAMLVMAGQHPIRAEDVSIDPNIVEVAAWEGWGTSLSWWGVYSGQWPRHKQREINRRLFGRGPDALGLNIVRYNAGGTSPDADPQLFRYGANVPIVLEQDGSWHLDRDRAQIQCLLLARLFGANIFELFVDSPPYWMLNNGNTRGGDNGGENLNWDFHDDYARWLVQVAQKFEDTYGIRFSYIEPFNEPSASWWNPATSRQEGCRITWGAQARIIKYLKSAIDESGRDYKITASDEFGAQEAYNTLNWLTSPGLGGLDNSSIHKVNVHAYSGWQWQESLRALASQRGIDKIWMSEVTFREWGNLGFVPYNMLCALPVTRSIVNDIKRLKPSAWLYWQPVEPLQYDLRYNYTYGLLPTSVDTEVTWDGRTYGPGDYVVAKSFYAMKQFTSFIRPGSRLVSANEFWTVAALSPSGKRLIIVVHNDATNSKNYNFDLSRFASVGDAAKVWRTKDDENVNGQLVEYNCRRLDDKPIENRRFVDTVPARSVTTYVIKVKN
jgi:O-glycosyl hydrolase